MGRTINTKNVPHMRPVEKIELPENHSRGKVVAFILLLAVGVAALIYAFVSFMGVDSGWREIEVSASSENNCGSEFVFMYELGAGGVSASAENRALTALYTVASEQAYRMFNNDMSFEEMTNVYDINRHPNEVMQVEDALYQAFSLLQNHGNRYLYLAPVYNRYDDLFFCNDDSQLVDFDPYLSEEVREEYAKIAAFANDPDAVELQLLGDNQIRLYVSEEYLDYASREGITDFIDFFWMKNAFIVDYLAEVMISCQYTCGSISSYDGFVRNLEERDASYSFHLYDRLGQTVYPAAVMRYSGSMSIVYLRNYGMNSLDFQHYYELASGEIRTPYLDVRDGFCKSATDNLVSYSRDMSCAEILVLLTPIYIADTFRKEETAALADENIYSVYCEDNVIYYNDPSLILTQLYEGEDISYSVQYRQ